MKQQGFIEIASSKVVVKRALKVALVVGTILGLINYFEKLINLSLSPMDLCKIALTYLVPYAVSTWSAVQAIRDKAS